MVMYITGSRQKSPRSQQKKPPTDYLEVQMGDVVDFTPNKSSQDILDLATADLLCTVPLTQLWFLRGTSRKSVGTVSLHCGIGKS